MLYAVSCAIKQNKPIFLDYTGHGCANCRDVEARVWSDASILPLLKNELVVLALYGDDKKLTLPENERYKNEFGKEVTTLGKQASDFMYSKFKQQAQPYYTMLVIDSKASVKGKLVLREVQPPMSYTLDVSLFRKFLEKGLKGYL